MADAEKKLLTRLVKLYDALRETQAKEYELTEEIGRLLKGEPGINDFVKRAIAHWGELWGARYRGAYQWHNLKDIPQLKRLIKTLGVDELLARMTTYIRDSDPFYVKSRHGFGLFASQINRFAGEPAPTELELDVDAPADCKHQPRCKTDQEHTRKRSAELRAS